MAPIDLDRIIDNVILGRDDSAWGPNNMFRFPERGGTGAIWNAVAALTPERHFHYNAAAAEIDADKHIVRTAGGEEYSYDFLISSLPLDVLGNLVGDPAVAAEAEELKYATTHIVGVGLGGATPEHAAGKTWIYYPEDDCPFYRVTVFSNYAPSNVPDPARYWSVIAEVSESAQKPVDAASVVQGVIKGLRTTRLIRDDEEIASVWHRRVERGYPVPTIDRDEHVHCALSLLDRRSIYSRGRFGVWKYEVSNQDHSCMQGVEAVDRIVLGTPELTAFDPAKANSGVRRHRGPNATLSETNQ